MKLMQDPKRAARYFCILVYVSGLLGMMSPMRDWFVALTPVSLLLSAAVLAWHQPIHNARLTQWAIGAYLIGLVSEIIGVNTGLIFGEYAYGTVLGPKIWATPLMIGVNWYIVTYTVNEAVWRVLPRQTSLFLGAIVAALGCTLLDWIIEPVAIDLGYWSWATGLPPVQNYIGWFWVSLIVSLAYGRTMTPGLRNSFAPLLLALQVLFFLGLYLTPLSSLQ
jgi:bisanhydrobacterioruberin hydratase